MRFSAIHVKDRATHMSTQQHSQYTHTHTLAAQAQAHTNMHWKISVWKIGNVYKSQKHARVQRIYKNRTNTQIHSTNHPRSENMMERERINTQTHTVLTV